MNKMLQVSQVAILSQAIERKYWAEMDKFNGDESAAYYPQSQRGFSRDNLLTLIENANDDLLDHGSAVDFTNKSATTAQELGKVIDTDDVDPFTGGLGEAQKARIADLLGRWEEPGRGHLKSVSQNCILLLASEAFLTGFKTFQGHISVGSVLQFRRALGK